MLHLSHLLAPIQRHHPEIITDFIVDYCTCADIPGDESYHYGWGSLKWALSYVADKDPDNVGMMLFHIICESIAKKFDNSCFETGILKFHSIRDFKKDLRDIDPIDVTEMPYEIVGNFKIIINTTGRKITAMIQRRIPNADIIVSVHKGSHPSVTLQKALNIPMFQEQLLDLLGTEDGGWELLANPTGTTLVNHSDIDISPMRIIEIITPALIGKTV